MTMTDLISLCSEMLVRHVRYAMCAVLVLTVCTTAYWMSYIVQLTEHNVFKQVIRNSKLAETVISVIPDVNNTLGSEHAEVDESDTNSFAMNNSVKSKVQHGDRKAHPATEAPRELKNRTVLLLSYQRTGSTYLGREMFLNNPDVFYSYEPLDGIYCAMYGTEAGYNIPSDITFHENGTYREPPQYELEAVTWALSRVLNCSIPSLPLQMVLHPFMDYKLLKSCLANTAKVTWNSVAECQTGVTFKTCGRYLRGDRATEVNPCLEYLWFGKESLVGKHRPDLIMPFRQYGQCLKNVGKDVPFCASLLQMACRVHPVRVVKTVRATMTSSEALFRENPDFRLLHLIRDPRGVILSRRVHPWTQGAYETMNIIREQQDKLAYTKEDVVDFVKKITLSNTTSSQEQNDQTLDTVIARHMNTTKAGMSSDQQRILDTAGEKYIKSGQTMEQRQARVYCNTVLRDLEDRKRLESLFPGRILQIVYDDFIRHPASHLQRVYDFLELPIPSNVREHFQDVSEISVKKSKAWNTALTSKMISDIEKACKKLFKVIRFD